MSQRLKHLKDSLSSLTELFTRNITGGTIAEPLVSFDEGYPLDRLIDFMNERIFDVVGIRRSGVVVGFVSRDGVSAVSGTTPFAAGLVVDASAPLLEVLHRIKGPPHRLFVSKIDHVAGIITKGDLYKAPVRMWLFGLFTLFEMNLLKMIREHSPEAPQWWMKHLSQKRFKEAQKLFAKKNRCGAEIDLSDCLEYCDKATIVMKTPEICERYFSPRSKYKKILPKLEHVVRNPMFHASDFLKGDWPEVFVLADEASALLAKIEDEHRSRNKSQGG